MLAKEKKDSFSITDCYTLIDQLNEIIREDKFRENLIKLIENFIKNDKYSCHSCQIFKKHALFTTKIGDCSYDLRIVFDNSLGLVEYDFTSSDARNNQAGSYKKTKNHTFTNVCEYKFEGGKYQTNLEKKHTISVFNKDMIEQFKYVANDYQSYYINDGKKCFIPSNARAFQNVLNVRKQIRTRGDNIIEIVKTQYYNDNMKQYDELFYGIAPNINNDPYVQLTSTGKLDNRYIPYAGEYNSISHEKYLDYMHGNIDDDELFKDYKQITRRCIF